MNKILELSYIVKGDPWDFRIEDAKIEKGFSTRAKFPSRHVDISATLKGTQIIIQVKPRPPRGFNSVYIGRKINVQNLLRFPIEKKGIDSWSELEQALADNGRALVAFDNFAQREYPQLQKRKTSTRTKKTRRPTKNVGRKRVKARRIAKTKTTPKK